MFHSSNPVLTRQKEFQPQYSSAPYSDPQYGDPRYQGQGPDIYGGYGGAPSMPPQQPVQGVMTMEDVITKTAICLALVAGVAAAAWFFIPDALVIPALLGAGLLSIVAAVAMIVIRKVNPAVVIGYSLIEGVFVGMLSKIFEFYYPGIVVAAVVSTFLVAGVVLAAYRFFNLGRIASRIRKVVLIATAGLALALVANFLLSLTGVVNLGLRAGVTGPVGMLPILVSIVAVVLASLNLILDFEFIETGIRNRVPASMSWTAAFGLTVTMVWLYTELLRILSYFRR
ncbi:Bax inhibitor-1/YccA family protein [Enemella sp. A6]|uniref:Bax inhibitor-1/YccA family protein n=1 Tax=Enemella sp. A6 TaxID=3440152 RepID=UPI003EB8C41E